MSTLRHSNRVLTAAALNGACVCAQFRARLSVHSEQWRQISAHVCRSSFCGGVKTFAVLNAPQRRTQISAGNLFTQKNDDSAVIYTLTDCDYVISCRHFAITCFHVLESFLPLIEANTGRPAEIISEDSLKFMAKALVCVCLRHEG